MRLLVLSFYYPPDLSAGSFRITALVAALRELAGSDLQVDVVTTLPNRYHTFVREAAEYEEERDLWIRRIRLPQHGSDMLGQSRAFLQFARQACAATADRQHDMVLATSSRLLTAALGAWIAGRKRVPLYLDIRDIFVDTIGDVLPAMLAWPARHAFALLELWTMRRAVRINLVSRGFAGYFRRRYPGGSFAWFTNGIDDEFLSQAADDTHGFRPAEPIEILYAGNVGEGQGLHYILPGLALALRGVARFTVIGAGGRRGALESALAAAGADNVELRQPVSRSQLLQAYSSADVLFLHLGRHPAFEKVLPSKVFEYAALGKPVLAGVAGYASDFIRQEVTNAAVFPPGDIDAAQAALRSLTIAHVPRPDFVNKYKRSSIAREMAHDVLAVMRRQP